MSYDIPGPQWVNSKAPHSTLYLLVQIFVFFIPTTLYSNVFVLTESIMMFDSSWFLRCLEIYSKNSFSYIFSSLLLVFLLNINESLCSYDANPKRYIVIFIQSIQGLYSLRRHRPVGVGIPIINLRWSLDHHWFIMGIPILTRYHF